MPVPGLTGMAPVLSKCRQACHPLGEADESIPGVTTVQSVINTLALAGAPAVLNAGTCVLGIFDPQAAFAVEQAVGPIDHGADEALLARTLASNTARNIMGYLERVSNWRLIPGIATGAGTTLTAGRNWMRGQAGNAGVFPRQIADKLRGMRFRDFDEFRETFWKEVAKDEELARQFTTSNRTLMSRGRAPKVIISEAVGEHNTYELHHPSVSII
jgi:hypothetical protein